MLDKHDHFLLRDEALEVLPRLPDIVGLELGVCSIPKDTSSERIEVLHELALAGQFNLHRTVTETTRAAPGEIRAVALNSTHGIVQSDELDVGVHGLAGDAVHDDVDRLVSVVQNLGVATKESDDLCTLRGEGNL